MSFETKTTIARLALCTAFTISLTACGNSAPSESDAKQAVQAELGDCKYVDLSDFTRVNGIKQGEGLYDVEVQYTVTITPDSDQWDQLKQWVQDRKDLYTAMKDEGQIDQQIRQAGNPDVSLTPEHQAADQKVKDLQQKVASGYAPDKMLREMSQACPNTPADLLSTYIYKSRVNGDGEAKLQYSRTLSMIKTDNGWQQAR